MQVDKNEGQVVQNQFNFGLAKGQPKNGHFICDSLVFSWIGALTYFGVISFFSKSPVFIEIQPSIVPFCLMLSFTGGFAGVMIYRIAYGICEEKIKTR